MKQKIWKHSCNSETLEGFIEEKTGKTIKEITAPSGKRFKRFKEVKELILEAVKTGRTIYVVGDYDADGIDSVCIIVKLLRALGAVFYLIIPKREAEGYGLSQKIIDRIPDGVLLITIDNGITAVEQLKNAKERGMTTIVLDHHTAGDALPDVDVLVDPSAIGEADYTHYCGAGIAYRLAEYILGEDHPILKELSTYAAMGTIGDVVELSGDNRQIVTEGLKNIKEGNCTNAFKSLAEKALKTDNPIAQDYAFNFVPVLNAAERLYDGGAAKVCSILTKNNNYDEGIAYLLETNQKRKDKTAEIMSKLDFESIKEDSSPAVFICDKNIPVGIAGIIAGQISEKTGKPSFVFGYAPDGTLKGSARNPVEGIIIIDEIRKHSDLLLGCGGHPGAAGLSLKAENYDSFRNAINSTMAAKRCDDADYIMWDITANDLSIKGLSQKIFALEPTGEGLPAPRVRIKTFLKETKPFGGDKDAPDEKKPHIRFNFANFNAVGFNMNNWYREQLKLIQKPRFVELVGVLTDNVYKDQHSIQMRIIDFELS